MPEFRKDVPQALRDALGKEGIVIAFDYGRARIGVAVGNSVSCTARPLYVISWKTAKQKWSEVTQILKDWLPSVVIVGVPRHKDGNPNSLTQECKNFAAEISRRYKIYTVETDERYSSVEAQEYTDSTGTIDDVAAQVILEQWFKETFLLSSH
ncbi:MAG: Holliday junction resolvase RuvX [Burkholderiales bacterium]|nr:Holliday junction resolvase RuvX [Burkholderiales bacterium]